MVKISNDKPKMANEKNHLDKNLSLNDFPHIFKRVLFIKDEMF